MNNFERGDIIAIDLQNASNALVVSPYAFNEATKRTVICPIKEVKKSWPFEVTLTHEGTVTGVVLSDHVVSIHIEENEAQFIEKANRLDVEKVIARLKTFIVD